MTKRLYEKRSLLYLDVLGWTAETREGDGKRLLRALQHIHTYTEEHNEHRRESYRKQDGERVEIAPGTWGKLEVLSHVFQIQCGAFSDHFTYSLPRDFGGRILTAGQRLILRLLQIGFLVRGAIVIGDLYHRDNIIFGPALIQAHEIESRQAFYPRIIVSSEVLQEFRNERLEDGLVIDDGTGRMVLNPFWLPFRVTDPNREIEVTKRFLELNWPLWNIKSIIEKNIRKLESSGRAAHAQKWHYMHSFIEGPVLKAQPRLKPFWK